MNISPDEAEEALAAVQDMVKKTRHSIASSNAHISLIVTGIVWLIGFLATQFLSGAIVAYIWIGASIIGTILASALSIRKGSHVRSPLAGVTAKRIGVIWLLLVVTCVAALAVAWPLDGKQLTVFIVLFNLIGWLMMGLLLSITSVWPGLIIIALALAGYFLLPGIFYLWMGLLVGGGMIALGIYIRSRW